MVFGVVEQATCSGHNEIRGVVEVSTLLGNTGPSKDSASLEAVDVLG